jgi:hypothetical protein
MSKILLVSISMMFLFGCKTTGTYEQTSLDLTGLELVEQHWGYHKSWAPLGSKDGYDMTDAQKEQQAQSLSQCIKKLKASHVNKPNPAFRAVQLIDCMESFGWHLVVEELFITT